MHHHSHHEHKSPSTLKLAFFLNLVFTVAEIIGGVITGSIAILADAVHDLGDSLALGLAWWFEGVASRKRADEYFTYGYRRLSLLAALLNGVVLTAGSTLVLTQAVPRFFDLQETHTTGMIGFAIVGVAVNGFAAWRTSKGATMNESVVSWHLLEDVLGWVAVLIGAIVMHFTNWWWVDPLLAVCIAAFILFNVVRRLWGIGRLFLQVAPEGVNVTSLQTKIAELPGVADLHHFHLWSLDGEHHVATIHARIEAGVDPSSVKLEIRSVLAPHGFEHMTIETEHDDADCSMPDAEG